MDQNTADHQGQLYFQNISLVKIKLTLRVRVSLAHENKADLDGPLISFIFMDNNKADHQGQFKFRKISFVKLKRILRVSFILTNDIFRK